MRVLVIGGGMGGLATALILHATGIAIVRSGEMFCIPKGVPHLRANLSDQPCIAVIARADRTSRRA
jgi:uncharacterized RmlC-like cupin family protein